MELDIQADLRFSRFWHNWVHSGLKGFSGFGRDFQSARLEYEDFQSARIY